MHILFLCTTSLHNQSLKQMLYFLNLFDKFISLVCNSLTLIISNDFLKNYDRFLTVVVFKMSNS